ncbi:hypothetical protein GCM10011512_03780 [Tersicoccus solisilvae]|uniref:Uncharacterized protein n=1 Tax=Tersicoccus solisilvae TaxID=1882339 RepID=A0ABQ1NQC3_9MICC|nr:hypothetical protein [Tersicoccus solisilvae]GGC80306.1 hypothetical protein GCM10011512_03780 [Tersicoccus solisilvae]
MRHVRRAAVLWALTFVGVLVVAVVVVTTVNARGYGPEHAVRAYLSALRDGDGSRALGLLGASVPDGNPALLTGDPLKRSVERLDDVDLSVGARTGDDATVTARYTLDGQAGTTVFPVHRAGSSWLFFDRWELAGAALPRTTVTFPGQDRARVNGTTVAAPGGKATLVSFVPARLIAGWSGTMLQAPERSTTVTSLDDAPTLALAAEPTPAMVTSVRDQLRRMLDRCASQQVLAPAGCPFYHFSDNLITGPVTWRITRYPQPQIASRDGAWTVRPLTGQAELRTRETDLFTGVEKELRSTEDFTFTAELDVDGDTVTVRPRITDPGAATG